MPELETVADEPRAVIANVLAAEILEKVRGSRIRRDKLAEVEVSCDLMPGSFARIFCQTEDVGYYNHYDGVHYLDYGDPELIDKLVLYVAMSLQRDSAVCDERRSAMLYIRRVGDDEYASFNKI